MNEFPAIIERVLNAIQDGSGPTNTVWIYFLITLMTAVEGPLVILVASTAASAGMLKPIPVFLAASVGNLSGDLAWYMLGYYSKLDWIFKRVKWFRLNNQNIENLKLKLMHHSSRILFLAKLTNGLIVPALVTAGLIRVPIKRWFPFAVIAEVIVTGTLVLTGYYAATYFMKVEKGLQYLAVGFTILFILVIFFIARKVLRQKTAINEIITDHPLE